MRLEVVLIALLAVIGACEGPAGSQADTAESVDTKPATLARIDRLNIGCERPRAGADASTVDFSAIKVDYITYWVKAEPSPRGVRAAIEEVTSAFPPDLSESTFCGTMGSETGVYINIENFAGDFLLAPRWPAYETLMGVAEPLNLETYHHASDAGAEIVRCMCTSEADRLTAWCAQMESVSASSAKTRNQCRTYPGSDS